MDVGGSEVNRRDADAHGRGETWKEDIDMCGGRTLSPPPGLLISWW